MSLRPWRHPIGLLCAGLTLAAQQPDQTAFLTRARQAYYSLAAERMDRFQATLVPNWRLLLEEGKTPPESIGPATEKLSDIRFNLTVDRKGTATISHNTVAAENDQVAAGLKQIYNGMEQMTTGFFETWCVFMVNPPLPELGKPFHLDELGAWHILTYEDGPAKVETTLGTDFAVNSMKVVSKEFISTINPTFSRTDKGFILTSYQATYRSTAAGEATDLKVTIENQELDGLTLPKKMDLRGTYGGSPFHIEVSFMSGHATRY